MAKGQPKDPLWMRRCLSANQMFFGRRPQRISKRLFYQMGGFANSTTFRRMKRGVWHYFQF